MAAWVGLSLYNRQCDQRHELCLVPVMTCLKCQKGLMATLGMKIIPAMEKVHWESQWMGWPWCLSVPKAQGKTVWCEKLSVAEQSWLLTAVTLRASSQLPRQQAKCYRESHPHWRNGTQVSTPCDHWLFLLAGGTEPPKCPQVSRAWAGRVHRKSCIPIQTAWLQDALVFPTVKVNVPGFIKGNKGASKATALWDAGRIPILFAVTLASSISPFPSRDYSLTRAIGHCRVHHRSCYMISEGSDRTYLAPQKVI